MPCHARLSSPLRDANGIIFDSAAGVAGDVLAPEITHNGHRGDDGWGTVQRITQKSMISDRKQKHTTAKGMADLT